MVSSNLLKVSKLCVDFKLEKNTIPILRDLSFEIDPGETLAIVGETGCGKSMTTQAIMRVLPTPQALPPRGEVFFKGKDLLKMSPKQMQEIRGKEIGMIFQDPRSALNPVYPIGDQLLEVCYYKLGMEGKKAKNHVIAALEEVGLSNPEQLFHAFPHQLSGGMLQRAMIAMALLSRPSLLIADEPTTALDVTTQSQILDLLKRLKESHKMSLLLITHDMGVVAQMADHVIVMYAGQKIESAPTKDLFRFNLHPYTQALLQAMPHPFIPRGTLPVLKGNVPDLKALPKGCSFHPRCPHALPFCKDGHVPYFHREGSNQEVKCWLYDQELQWKVDEETFT